MTLPPFALAGVGLLAPGLAGWSASQAVLCGQSAYNADLIMPPAVATCLPTNERRRTTATVRLALHVAQEALVMAALEPAAISTVFASSGGDSEVLDQICRALLEPERPVSPTHFHQSVHNTPAGYWAIATGCRQPSLSLAAYDDSFAVGLREAMTLAWIEDAPVLLVVYDLPLPLPLANQRPLVAPFGVALLLTPDLASSTPTLGQLGNLTMTGIGIDTNTGDTALSTLDDPELERLRQGNPAARALPILCAIARQQAAVLTLATGQAQSLQVAFTLEGCFPSPTGLGFSCGES